MKAYPKITSNTIMIQKPNKKESVGIFECFPCAISGTSSSITTNNMAPAAKLKRKGKHCKIQFENKIVT